MLEIATKATVLDLNQMLKKAEAELEKAKAQIIADDSKVLWQENEIADLMGEVEKAKVTSVKLYKIIQRREGTIAELQETIKTLKRTIKMIEGAK